MAPQARPKASAIQDQIGRFLALGREAYLDEIGPRRGGRTYFIVADGHHIDMKAIWFGACKPKPASTPNSVTIAPILERMGFTIAHEMREAADTLAVLEKHKWLESGRWTHNQAIAKSRIEFSKQRCEGCGNFRPDKYPSINGSLLEVHHLTPFSTLMRSRVAPVTLADVVALCANCHRMIHALARQSGENPTLKQFKSQIR